MIMDGAQLERELARLHAECWGWALACVGRDRELAEEALQAAYVRMLAGAARYNGRSSVRTWAFGVIRLTALEELRRARRSVSRTAGDEASMMDAADETPGPDLVAERMERSAILAAALAALSPRQREVVQLVFYHGMTIEEASVVMQVSLGSARTHYDRAKRALAERLTVLQEDVG